MLRIGVRKGRAVTFGTVFKEILNGDRRHTPATELTRDVVTSENFVSSQTTSCR
jgi:hypothetical protein